MHISQVSQAGRDDQARPGKFPACWEASALSGDSEQGTLELITDTLYLLLA